MKTIKLFTMSLVATIFATGCDPSDAENQGLENESQEFSLEEGAFNSTIKTNKYRGFTIRIDENVPERIIDITKAQIDEMYNSKLKRSTIKKMREVNAIVLISNEDNSLNDLLYEGFSREVILSKHNVFKVFDRRENINLVLHELTHFYDQVQFPNGGILNDRLLELYRSARRNKVYPRDSKILQTKFEYIATAVEAYFAVGSTTREPFNKASLIEKDPELAKFIEANF